MPIQRLVLATQVSEEHIQIYKVYNTVYLMIIGRNTKCIIFNSLIKNSEIAA